MNKEIKEIKIKTIGQLLDYVETEQKAKELINYITNLQQENERLKVQLTDTEWQWQNTRCKYEKQYKKGITEEVIEDIETCFFNRENPSMIPIDSLDICHIFGYIDYLKDYKSRCEEAIEYIKENIADIDYIKENYDINIVNDFDISVKEISDLLNILQNGDDANE